MNNDDFRLSWRPGRGRVVRLDRASRCGPSSRRSSSTASPHRCVTQWTSPPARLLRCETALVRLSGAVDREGYLREVPDLPRDAKPVAHFCRWGWRTLRQPEPRVRRVVVLAPVPRPRPPRREPAGPLPRRGPTARAPPPAARRPPSGSRRRCTPGQPVRRVALFAALRRRRARRRLRRRLPRGAEPVRRRLLPRRLPDGAVRARQAGGRDRRCLGHPARTYDFGSYSLLARDLVGWEVIDGYDELLLVNDSAYLLTPAGRGLRAHGRSSLRLVGTPGHQA